MSAVNKLIEKLTLACLGERPDDVMEVLPVFAAVMCERYGVTPEEFAAAMRRSNKVAPRDPLA